MKTGRNALCPCGSGKKYKKCCGALSDIFDPADDRFTQISQTLSSIKIKLEQNYRGVIRQMRADNLEHFLEYTVSRQLAPEFESLFSEWLWFDALTEENMTLAESYWQNNHKYMEPWLSICWSALISSCVSIYIVDPGSGGIGDSSPDSTLVVTDVFNDTAHTVLVPEQFHLASEQELLLLGRLVQLESDRVFSGMVLTSEFDAAAKDGLAQLKTNFADSVGTDASGFLKHHSPVVLGWFDHTRQKQETDRLS